MKVTSQHGFRAARRAAARARQQRSIESLEARVKELQDTRGQYITVEKVVEVPVEKIVEVPVVKEVIVENYAEGFQEGDSAGHGRKKRSCPRGRYRDSVTEYEQKLKRGERQGAQAERHVEERL